jgi:chaperonin GroES
MQKKKFAGPPCFSGENEYNDTTLALDWGRVLIRFYFLFNYRFKEERSKAMEIKPLQDRVLVERIEKEEKTAGGIIIPDTAKEKPAEGKVVAVGPGKTTEEGKVIALDVEVGDHILFAKYAGTEVKVDGVEYLLMREEEILGVIEGSESQKDSKKKKK